LQIEIMQLYKLSNNTEQKFLKNISSKTFTLIDIIESHLKMNNKFNEPFINLKHELENSLNKSHLYKSMSNSEKIYYDFQNLVKKIEKTLKLTI
ncbi:MAG: hypothetical protein IKA36_03025, partial [Clostridia bacterium]|nr:hypothetical protein [Clostridia bacterium]